MENNKTCPKAGKEWKQERQLLEYLTGKYNFFCNIPFYYFEGDDIFSSTITENQTQVKEKNN